MLHAVIMAGGGGTRFWPRSRQRRPKQFLTLAGEQSLLQQAFERLEAQVSPAGIWVITAAGEHLGTLRLPEAPHNLAWGGDGHDLYITALTSVYRLRLATKGATL